MTETRTRISILNEAIGKVGEKISYICPRCGQMESSKWKADLAGIWTSPLPLGKKLVIPPQMIPALTLTCQECGYVAIHNLKAVGVEVQ